MHGSIKLNSCREEANVEDSDSLIEGIMQMLAVFLVGALSFALGFSRVALSDLNIMDG